ncbi:Hypothetical protein PBC10988_25240 [Planctomycetales bacterium 10988]|nr:Hypothetical protein PBC10988_25240 [Planctomycetales bacterium 10988]
MNPSASNPDFSNLSEEASRALENWIESLLVGTISPEEFEQLESILQQSAAARDLYLERVHLHSALQWELGAQAVHAAYRTLQESGLPPATERPGLMQENLSALEEEVFSLQESSGSAISKKQFLGWAIAASLLLCGGVVAWQTLDVKSVFSIPSTTVVQNESPSVEVEKWQGEEPLHIPEVEPALFQPSFDFAHKLEVLRPAIWEASPEEEATRVKLTAGLVKITFEDERCITIQGPAEFSLQDESCELFLGLLSVYLPIWSEGFSFQADGLRIEEPGVSFGVSKDHAGRIQLAVFRGEVHAQADARYLGIPQVLEVTRDEGLEIEPSGTITTSIMNAQHRFAALKEPFDFTLPLLANASFEYPRSLLQADRVPSGWTLVSHPIANADRMLVRGGILSHNQRHLEQLPKPHGKQWAFLETRRFADGRVTHTSLHQAAGLVVAGATYQLQGTVGRPHRPAKDEEPLHYSISLFAGSADEGPTQPLQVWNSPQLLAPGESGDFSLEYQVPPDSILAGDQLFVVLSAAPLDRPGVQHILFDQVRLDRKAVP